MNNNKKYIYISIFFIILFIAAFFRFYRIREYMTFLGDEGRDALVVKHMIVDHKFTLLGPITSVGSMYMGPIYYYFMAPFLWIWHLDPVGPAIMVALFSVSTVGLIFILGYEFFHPQVGSIAAFLYAVSPLPIAYGHSSWNPNIVPFFSLLLIYSLLKILVQGKNKWIIPLGLALGILLQLHYVTFMFIPIVIVSFLIYKPRIPLVSYLTGLAAFLLAYSPFLLFELRHQFINTQAVWRFFWQQKDSSSTPFLIGFFNTIYDVTVRLFWRLIVITNAQMSKLFILLMIVMLVVFMQNIKKEHEKYSSFKLIMIWILGGIISFGLYRGVIYDYYFGSIFAVPYLLTGIVLYMIGRMGKLGHAASLIMLILLAYFNLGNSPLKIEPNNMVKNTETIAASVLRKTNGKPYNFALIAGRNSDHAYRYFFEIWNRTPMTIEPPDTDPQRKTVTDQLMVICEEKICQPLGHPLWEIAGFGRGEITDEWNVVTVKAFRLDHYKI